MSHHFQRHPIIQSPISHPVSSLDPPNFSGTPVLNQILHADRADAQDSELQHYWGRYLDELKAIARERDPEMFYNSLLKLGRRLEDGEKLAAAGTVYSAVLHGDAAAEDVRACAQQRLDVLNGRGPAAQQAEFIVQRLPGQILSAPGLIAMGSMGIGFQVGRLFTLGLSAGRGAFSTALAFRTAGNVGGFLAGSLAFSGAGKATRAASGIRQDWSAGAWIKEWAGEGTMLLGLMGMGGLAGTIAKRWLAGYGTIHRFGQAALPQLGLLTGIWSGNKLATLGGFSNELPEGMSWVDLFSAWMQFNLMGRLTRPLFGEGFYRLERRLDLYAEGLSRGPGGSGRMEALSARWAPQQAAPEGFRKTNFGLGNPRSLFPNQSLMSADSGGGQGGGARSKWKKTWPDSPAAKRLASTSNRYETINPSSKRYETIGPSSPAPPPVSQTRYLAQNENTTVSSAPPFESLTLRKAEPPAVEPYNLNSLLDRRLFVAYLNQSGFPVELVLESANDPFLVWGHAQLTSVVKDLLANAGYALRHHPNPRLLVRVQKQHLDGTTMGSLGFIAAAEPVGHGSYMLLRFQDNRPEVNPRDLLQVFEPNFSEKPDLTRVRQMIQDAGGFISVQSRRGQGTTFDLYLPKAFAEVSPTQASAAPAILFTREVLRAPVLVVEDDPVVRRLVVHRILKQMGFKTVLEAESGKMAVSILKDRQDIRVVLSDESLGEGVFGSKLLVEIQRAYPQIQTALYSGDAVERFQALRGTVGAILSKPFDPEHLAATLYRLIHRSMKPKTASRLSDDSAG